MLILHIGRHKTGTSSIQYFLHGNREELKKHGYIYPKPIQAIAAHHGIAMALKAEQDVSRYREMLKQLKAHQQNVLLSSEGFQQLGPKHIRRFAAGYPMLAVIYLREQFSYAWAAYAQIVCAGPEAREFEESLRNYIPRYYNFLLRWKSVTKNNLKIRIFERPRLVDGDVVADFCQTVFGLDKNKFSDIPSINETLGWRSVNFMRRLNGYIAEHPRRDIIKRKTFEALRQIGEKYPELSERPKFPEGFRERYQAQFAEQNKQIASEFLGIADQPLFDLSWRGDSIWNSHEGLAEHHIRAMCERVPELDLVQGVLKRAAA